MRDCYFKTSSNPQNYYRDIQRFPAADLYGNAMGTTDYLASRNYQDNGVALDMTKVKIPYQVGLAAWNATLNASRRIRKDTTLKPVIMCIGYNDTTNPDPSKRNQMDRALMKRVANTDRDFTTSDPLGAYPPSAFDRNSTVGAYFEPHTPEEIDAAFQKVASEILRLTQ